MFTGVTQDVSRLAKSTGWTRLPLYPEGDQQLSPEPQRTTDLADVTTNIYTYNIYIYIYTYQSLYDSWGA